MDRGYMKDIEIVDSYGEKVTHINVSRIFTYNVQNVVQQLQEELDDGNRGDVEITLDDVLERIEHLSGDDFDSPVGRLFFADTNGNEY
jgi:hypothetical protein